MIEVDIPNKPWAKTWLKRYAHDVLIPRFEQEAIYIKFIGPIEITLVTIGRSV
jgi:hypothetical protein